jgi:hypothetical protein
VSIVIDDGFYVQVAYMAIPKHLMPYVYTSMVTGAFNTSWELAGGLNYFPFDTRNFRLNGMVIGVSRSAFGSAFGYYTGGQSGVTLSLSADVFF